MPPIFPASFCFYPDLFRFRFAFVLYFTNYCILLFFYIVLTMHDFLLHFSLSCQAAVNAHFLHRSLKSPHLSTYLFVSYLSTVRQRSWKRLTQSGLTSHVGVRVDKAVRLVGIEDAGLDEAQQGVKLLQVVLDWGPRQQNSEVNGELQGKHTHGQAQRSRETE